MTDPKDKPPVPVEGSAIMPSLQEKGAILADAFRNAFGDHPAMGMASVAGALGNALDKIGPPVEPLYYLPTVHRPERIEIHVYHHHTTEEEPTNGDGPNDA